MNFIQNYFQKRTNNMIAHQDFELAEQFVNIDFSFGYTQDGSTKDEKTVGTDLFHLEGIFLDLTDITLSLSLNVRLKVIAQILTHRKRGGGSSQNYKPKRSSIFFY